MNYVFFDTGIEYQATKEHLKYLEQKYDIKIHREKAKVPVPLGNKKYGVPFLSKNVSNMIWRLQSNGFQWEDDTFENLYAKYPNCKCGLLWWTNSKGEGSHFNINRNSWLKEFLMKNPPPFKISDKGKAVGQQNNNILDNQNYGDYKVVETEGDMKYPKSIWTFSKPHPSIAIHPTQKPLDLCRYAIRTYSNEGDMVLDCCCGSGTIPLAAKIENRRYIGMDNGICTKKGKYYGQFWVAITAERIRDYDTNLGDTKRDL